MGKKTAMKLLKAAPGLYFRGDFHGLRQKLQHLRDADITTVICLLRRGDPDLLGLDWLEYVQTPLPDAQKVRADIAWAAAELAAERICRGRNVLVHCIAGRNRSGLVVGLTLVKLYSWSGQRAFERVREVAPHALANSNFEQYLREVEPC